MQNQFYYKSLYIILLLTLAFVTHAQEGQLDTSFDTDGIVSAQIGTSTDNLEDIAIDNNGKLVLVGTFINALTRSEIFVARYNTNGSLDATFDTDGIKTIPIGGLDDRAYAVEVQSDGKIVIAGKSYDGSYFDLCLLRLLDDGSFDTDFSTDGVLTDGAMYGGNMDFNVTDMTMQNDGKIVVVGYQLNTVLTTPVKEFVAYRYTSVGALDTSFDNDGKKNITFASRNSEPQVVKLQSDGKIIIAGYSYDSSNDYDFALTRLTTSGGLDGSFGSSGKVLTAIGNTWDAIWDMDIYDDDKIIVAGNSYFTASKYDITLVRYTANGALDTSFDTDGIVTTNFDGVNNYNEGATGVRILVNSKIVVSGTANSDLTLVRYNDNGSLDNTFDSDGIVTSGGVDQENGKALVVQEDGKMVVAGDINASTWDIILNRFNGTIAPLPVELTSFSASIIDNKITLNWQTATELNNFGFEIERSNKNEEIGNFEDLNLWEKVGFVGGNGNSSSPKSYSFTDEIINGGSYLYRLKQIDFDGNYEYSDVIEITYHAAIPNEYSLDQNFPNPFNPATIIQYSVMGNEFVTLIVYDILGNKISTLVNEVKSPGSYKINFDGSKLSSGVYFYHFNAGNYSSINKMILLK